MNQNIIKIFSRIVEETVSFISRKFSPKDEGKPIIITGAPRSGTTWVGDMFNSNRVRVYHEPFINHTLLWNWNLSRHNNFPADFSNFNNVINQIQFGKEWKSFTKYGLQNRYKQPLKYSLYASFGIKRGRIIIKDPGLCYLMEDFSQLFNCEVILLFRNPLSIVSSLKRLNWLPDERIKLIFQHPYFKKFDIHKFNIFEKNLESFSLIEKLAIQTGLLHYFMLDFSKKNPNAIVVFYEELANDPCSSFKKLFAKLNLRYDKINLKNQLTLSSTSTGNYEKNVHTTKRNSLEFKEIWNKRLTEEEINSVIKIYNVFNLGLYNFN